jgi:His/Glu/Gln/Arg/opine family amino acid ABC transporter permease subunit
MWSLSSITPYLHGMLNGLVVTLELSGLSFVIAVCLATLVATCLISPNRWLARLVGVYVEIFRGIPILVWLMIAYFLVAPAVRGIGISVFMLAVLALALNSAAYQAEVYRAGLLAVPRAQWEAASSIGLGWLGSARRVVLPQAVPAALPTTVNLLIYLIKGSALTSIIAVHELTASATLAVSMTFLPMQTYVVVALMYLIIVIPLTLLAHAIERRIGWTPSQKAAAVAVVELV